MDPIFFRPEGAFLGDVIPFYENDTFHLYYLKDSRKTGITADQTPWDLITTKDFVHFENHGSVLPTAPVDQPDNCCYTGSVIKDAQGVYHLFYTAHNNHNPLYMRDGRPVQTVMHATSGDLIHWTKHPDQFSALGTEWDQHDWRDPFVYADTLRGGYSMLLAARKAEGAFRRGGLVLRCYSEDLWHWRAAEPLYAPDMYLTHECPDLFQMGDWWYLAYSTFTDKFQTHYRMSRSPDGPWTAPIADALDARAFYAAKTAADGSGRRYAFGWIPTKAGDSDFGHYQWAGNLAVHELRQADDGTLLVRMPRQISDRFDDGRAPKWLRADGPVERTGDVIAIDGRERMAYAVFDALPEVCLIEAEIRYAPDVRSFGIGLHMSADLDEGYLYRIEPFHNRIVMDMWPRRPMGTEQHLLGGDVPFQVELERPIPLNDGDVAHIKMLVECDICVLYVNDVAALSTRTYNLNANPIWCAFAHDGEVQIEHLRVCMPHR